MSGRVWDNRGIWDDISYARRGDVELAYQRRGPTEGIPLLLVAGLGAQMLIWHDDFCGSPD